MESQQRAPSRTKPSMRPGFMQWAVAATGAEAAAAAAPLPPSLSPSPSPISRTSAMKRSRRRTKVAGTQAEESTAVYGTKRRGGGEDGKCGEEVEEVEEVEEEVEVTFALRVRMYEY